LVELPAVGPLAEPCSQTLDEILGVNPLTSAGRCGLLSCTYCGAYALVHEVGAVARTLREQGGSSIVVALHEIPLGSQADTVWSFAGPRLGMASAALRAKYMGGIGVRWTVEIDATGLANAHVLTSGKSTPRIGAVRRAFEAVGLGRSVELQHEITHPLSLAAYTSKIGLLAFAVPTWKAQKLALAYARQLNGGAFAHVTPGFFLRGASTAAEVKKLGRPLVPDIVEWAVSWAHYWAKTPPDLASELSAAGVPLTVDSCQTEDEKSAPDGGESVEPWEWWLSEW
jgi:hypothetical protein